MATQRELIDEWECNVKAWFEKGNLWGGLRLERVEGVIKVHALDYADLTRSIARPFDSYEKALAAVGASMDAYQAGAGEWLQPHRTAH